MFQHRICLRCQENGKVYVDTLDVFYRDELVYGSKDEFPDWVHEGPRYIPAEGDLPL